MSTSMILQIPHLPVSYPPSAQISSSASLPTYEPHQAHPFSLLRAPVIKLVQSLTTAFSPFLLPHSQQIFLSSSSILCPSHTSTHLIRHQFIWLQQLHKPPFWQHLALTLWSAILTRPSATPDLQISSFTNHGWQRSSLLLLYIMLPDTDRLSPLRFA